MLFACNGEFLGKLKKKIRWEKKQTVRPTGFAEICEEFTRFNCSQFAYFRKHSGYCMNARKTDGQ